MVSSKSGLPLDSGFMPDSANASLLSVESDSQLKRVPRPRRTRAWRTGRRALRCWSTSQRDMSADSRRREEL
eukprot:6308173-Prymnesium_polylepis.1